MNWKEWKSELKILGEILNSYAKWEYESGDELQNDAINKKL